MHPSSAVPSGYPMKAAWVLLLWQADYVSGVVGLVVPGPVGCQALPCAEAASCWLADPVMRWQIVEPCGGVALVLAHWWAESGSRILWGCCPSTGR